MKFDVQLEAILSKLNVFDSDEGIEMTNNTKGHLDPTDINEHSVPIATTVL